PALGGYLLAAALEVPGRQGLRLPAGSLHPHAARPRRDRRGDPHAAGPQSGQGLCAGGVTVNNHKESRLNQFLKQFGKDVVEVEHHVLDAVKRVPHYKHDHAPMRNVHEQVMESFTPLERIALVITQRVGSFGFFLLIFGWTVIWLLWNT